MTARSAYVAPTVIVEYAPTFHFANQPGSGDWVPLDIDGRTRLMELAITRGRRDVFDRFEPGTATLVLDNSDGYLSDANSSGGAYGPDYGSGTPIRVRMVDPSIAPPWTPTYTVWSGYIRDGWQPSGSMQAATVTVQAVDAMGAAVDVPMPRTRWVAQLTYDRPVVWWRGTMTNPTVTSTNGQRVIDYGTAAADGVGANSSRTTAAMPLIPDDDGAMRVWESAAIATQKNISWTGGDFTFVCWFQIEDTGSGRYLAMGRTGSAGGPVRWAVAITAGGYLYAEVRNASDTVIATCLGGEKVNDGRPHICHVAWQPSGGGGNFHVNSDLGGISAVMPGTAVGGGGWLRLGSVSAGDARVLVDEWAYYDKYYMPTVVGMAGVSERLDAFVADSAPMWGSDTLSSRVAKLKVLCGFSFATVTTTSAPSGPIGNYVPQPNLAAQLTATAEALAGAVWTRRDGAIKLRRFRDLGYYSGTKTPTEQQIYQIVARISDRPTHAPIEGVSPPVVRATSTGTTGELVDRVINEVATAANGDTGPRAPVGAGIPARDLTSQQRYGRRALTLTTDADPAELEVIAGEILAARSTPTREIGEVVIRPYGDQVATTFVLRDLELEARVLYSETDPATGAVRLDDVPVRVQAESWSWRAGVDWTVTLKLAETVPS